MNRVILETESPVSFGRLDPASAAEVCPGDPRLDAAIACLSRRDEQTWRALMPVLARIAGALARSFPDVTTPDDALGDLALASHEHWIDAWCGRAHAGKSSITLVVFLRDKMRDRLREERRRRARRLELLSLATDESTPIGTVATPEMLLSAEELRARSVAGVPAADSVVQMREAGLDQREIAARTKLSLATVSRRLALVAAVLATLIAGLWVVWLATRHEDRIVEPSVTPVRPPAFPAGDPTAERAVVPTAPLVVPSTDASTPNAPNSDAPSDASTAAPNPPSTTAATHRGVLQVISIGAPCELTIDDAPAGTTPVRRHVTAGQHVVRCSPIDRPPESDIEALLQMATQGSGAQRRVVHVPKDGTARIVLDFSTPSGRGPLAPP